MSRYFTLLAIFLLPAYIFRFGVFGIPTNVFEATIGVSLLAFIIEKLWGPSTSLRTTRIRVGFWPVYLLLLFAIISVAFSPDKTVALGIVKGWFVVPAILYFLVINLFDKKNIRLITIPLFVSLLLVSVWSALQKFGVITTLFYQSGDPGFTDYLVRFRSFGPFESPNYLAMFVLSVGFLSLPILGFFQKTIDKALILAFYILPLYALYTSRSLGGLLAFGFGLICFFAFGLAKTYRARLVNSGSKIAAWVGGLLATAAGFAVIFSSISNETYSTHIRLDIYHYSWQLIQLHPIFGIGLGQFQNAVGSISSSNLGFTIYGLSYAVHPQNLFLALWLNLGLLGLLAFLYILGSFFWSLGRPRGDILILVSIFAAMATVVIHGLVDTTYFKNDLCAIFWLMLAVGFLIKKPDAAQN